MKLFDSHLHLNHPDMYADADTIWQEAQENNVNHGVVIGYDIASSERAIDVASRHDGLYAAVGLSPHDVNEAPDDYINLIAKLAQHPKVVAIGECGLEYHHPIAPADVQIRFFREQIELANQLQLPLVIHLRNGDDDFLSVIQKTPPTSAILHCFTGSSRVVEEANRRSYYVSYSGIVTFKKAVEVQETVLHVDHKGLLIETDAPYLAPTPFRGKPCHPKMIVKTMEKVADLRNKPADEIAEVTYNNAMRVFGL